MKNSQKGFINIIIAIVVVVAIAGYVAWDNNLIPKNILSNNSEKQENVEINTRLFRSVNHTKTSNMELK
ncbi:MAG: hypothetical protein WCW03_00915 [Candidatus Paceibacterota bacterium]|jgi:FtsH-binding integral membrane protein